MTQSRSKMFVEIGDYYLFSLKREPNRPESDHRLELLGGKQESGETPFQALIREVREEEASGILAQQASDENPPARVVDVSGEAHHIYRISLRKNDWHRLVASPRESYGFHLVPKVQLEPIPEADRARYTPKTLAIFRALNMLS